MRSPPTVFEAVAAWAAVAPARPALSGDGRTWSYRELRDEAERIAAGLLAAGCRPQQPFAIVAGNHPRTCVAWLAGARCGAVPSLLNSLLTAPELAWILGHLRPSIVLVDAAHAATVASALAIAGLSVPVFDLDGRRDGGRPHWYDLDAEEPFSGPLPVHDDVLEVAYTSGTVSKPKGVVLTHAAVLERADGERELFSIGPSDAALAATPLFHQSGIRNTVLLMWLAGGHAVVAPKFSASTYWRQVADAGATFACYVETMLLILERQPVHAGERSHHVKVALGGGAPDFVTRIEDRFGFRLVQGYGMTECGLPVAVPADVPHDRLAAARRYAPGANLAGWPLRGVEVRIVDGEGNAVGEGAQGEILVRSGGLLREYLHDADATASALRDGWLRTGDLGRRGPEGAIYFVDRLKDMIRRGGENIAPKEIEDTLVGHPTVRQAVVFPVPDPLWIQETKAVVVLQPDCRADPEELWAWCATRLAAYKIPRYIEFRDTVPVSGSGRVQKQLLRAEPIDGAGRTFDRGARTSVSEESR